MRPPADWRLATEALASLAIAALARALLPFDRLVSAPKPSPHGRRTSEAPARIGWAVKAAARRAPWRAQCLVQAVAARAMLRRRGLDCTLYYGARTGGAHGLHAHVWLRVGESDIIGGDLADQFAVLGVYPEISVS